MAKTHQGVRRIGYFGSYARGDAGVGSDIDLVIVLTDATLPFEKRASEWDATNLPVPADVLVYTEKEWESLRQRERFYQTLMRETVWILEREGENRK
jgi:predicted nucleotidyltransferase